MNASCSSLLGLLGASVLTAVQVSIFETGFEGVPAGDLRSAETGAGTWTAEPGHALIDAQHHRSGAQCLHLVGGEARQIVLELPPTEARVDELTFWCERWTGREPFEFRIDQLGPDGWHEIFRGDDEILVGTFKSHVRIALQADPRKLRWTCTSPAGVLIDDVALGRAAPMELVSVTTVQPVVPCLVGNAVNRVAQIEVEASGSLNPIVVRELHVNLSGTSDLEDLVGVEILGPDGARFGEVQAPAEKLLFRGGQELSAGRSTFTISVALATDADIDGLVDAGCDAAQLSTGALVVPGVRNPRGAQRCGIALRNGGDSGSAAYRIPGLTTTNAGTLVAVYDVRWGGLGDLPGDVDVGMSRSLDGGRTWQPMQVIMDMGDDPEFRHDGIGDPSILYDPAGDTLWVAATWSHGNRAWHGSGPGLLPEETGQLMLARSDDDGLTWSEPINITPQVKRPEWCYLLQGPGRGICMADGTLVFAAQYQDTPEADRMPYSTILFSRDRGATWSIGTGPRSNTTEAQVAELEDGTLMLNMRDNRGGTRAIYTTRDLGQTWDEHATSRFALIGPVCNAALLKVGESRLAFVNPAVSSAPRRNMTIRLSPDLGATWPEVEQLLLDGGSCAGYPSATMIDGDLMGVLFEGSAAQLTFMRVPLTEIEQGAEAE